MNVIGWRYEIWGRYGVLIGRRIGLRIYLVLGTPFLGTMGVDLALQYNEHLLFSEYVHGPIKPI